jgi:hypothetical protein
MQIKTILKAAVAAIALTLGGTAAADAAPHGGFGHGGYGHGGFGYHAPVRHEVRRIVDHRIVFRAMNARHMRYMGNPYFVRDRYVVRTYDRFGRVAFVQINPYTGAIIGFIRL